MNRDSRHLPNGRDGEDGSGRSPSGAVPPQSGNRPNPVTLPTPIPLPDELLTKVAHTIFCEVGACGGEPSCFNGASEHIRELWIDAVRKGLALTATKPSGQVERDVVERVARALFEEEHAALRPHYVICEWGDELLREYPECHDRYMRLARAALAALSTQVQTVGGE